MPFRKRAATKKKKTQKRRPYGRRTRPYTTIIKGPNPFPDRMFTKLSYCDGLTLSSTSAPVGYVFRGNGAYDPYYAAGGHQPRGFDEYTNIYTKFTVLGSAIRFTGHTTVGNPTISLKSSLDTAIPSFIYADIEKGSTRIKLSEVGKPFFIKSFMSTSRIWGVTKKAVMSDDQYQGTTASTDPVKGWYWIISSKDESGSSCSIHGYFKIVYYIMFSARKALAQS